jgi:N-formylglutamate amidohydrolase
MYYIQNLCAVRKGAGTNQEQALTESDTEARPLFSEPSFAIPGVLECFDPAADPVPVLFESPHSGTRYPDDFHSHVPLLELRQSEDAWVDELYAAAPRHGAFLIRALFPRIYIDPNRHPRDIDPLLLNGEWPETLVPSEKTRSGIGLIWRLAPTSKPIYAAPLSVTETQARLATYYHPYHEAIAQTLDRLQEMFGATWHVDCHSMPSIANERAVDAGEARPDFAIGDRDGTTCSPMFTEFIVETLRGMGYDVRINSPYKGVELVRRHGDPVNRRNSVQIEVNRRLYMNEEKIEKTNGFKELQENITKLIKAITDYTKAATV